MKTFAHSNQDFNNNVKYSSKTEKIPIYFKCFNTCPWCPVTRTCLHHNYKWNISYMV